MFQKLVTQQRLTSIHYLGTLLLVIGMPSSKVLMSLGTMVLALVFVLGFQLKTTITSFRANKLLIPILAFVLIHLISLAWTSDFTYAADDLRIKVPLLLLPVFYSVRPISKGTVKTVFLSLFVLTVFTISMYNFLAFKGLIGKYTYLDFREMSLFGSHIRFGLMVAFAAAICLTTFKNTRWQTLAILLFCWLSFYTYYSQVFSGFIAWLIVVFSIGFYSIYKKSKTTAFLSVILLLITVISFSSFFILKSTQLSPAKKQHYHTQTSKGNHYFHDTLSEKNEHGDPIMVNICEVELREEWSKVSKISYDGQDLKHQFLKNTLIRFMDSKNLKKDGEHFKQLSKSDIKAIEKGIANVNDQNIGLLSRLNGLNYQLTNSSDPNGHSLLQRFEFWKTSLQIIKDNWLIGVGVGDVQEAFRQQYKTNQTILTKEHQLRAHNSFLTSWVSFGIIGCLIFCWMVCYYLYYYASKKEILPILFGLILISSFLFEDTLETQMGVTLFAFFYSFFFERGQK
jgi:hypothetical protein